MNREQVLAHAGGEVIVNSSGDLYFSVEHRTLIDQKCKLISLTKSGMALVEFNGKQLTVAPGQINPA
jgi:hypothetical protein